MRLLPPRRWFQFRLSTWFVLVAILACALTMQPYYRFERKTVETNKAAWDAACRTGKNGFGGPGGVDCVRTRSGQYIYFCDIERAAPNPVLLWPALAVAALVGWKPAWNLWLQSLAPKSLMMTESVIDSRRRWLRIGLRTVFVVAGSAAVAWIGLQFHQLRARNEVIHNPAVRCIQHRSVHKHLPFLWGALGEEAIYLIILPRSYLSQCEAIRMLFPEAMVMVEPRQ